MPIPATDTAPHDNNMATEATTDNNMATEATTDGRDLFWLLFRKTKRTQCNILIPFYFIV